tara:strand:- start:4854 stop:5045 length:192 start_codon:yes stop_codon:yes gene_type:complete
MSKRKSQVDLTPVKINMAVREHKRDMQRIRCLEDTLKRGEEYLSEADKEVISSAILKIKSELK